MDLYLIRHPTPLVAPGLCYGRSDLDVSEHEAARIAQSLAPRLPAGAPFFSSPMQRCLALASALGGARPHYDLRLVELDFGRWEMQPWDAIARADIDAWAADPVHYRPGGGESVLQMALRVAAFHAELRALRLARAVVLCHAGTMRLLRARQRGLAPLQMAQAAASAAHQIAYGELLFVPESINDV